MSDTDIYKKREAMPMGKTPEKKRRRRRSSSAPRAFDDKNRKRRSKNSGIRRMLHLSRKSENERIIWISVGVIFLVLLVTVALWQFVIQERLVREQERSDDYIEYNPNIPSASEVSLIPVPSSSEEPAASVSE
ncbi:hypothetical protein [Pontiella sp.]|uniref:hypothetical protein n=1 Tax=Pontiella sp. TaxID=2837462 RepID=UPI00356692DC